jgi:N-acetylglucosaminyldiphosphoundecaprenol N-acetyl-beta-D-mannosaminyltransferase
MLTREEMHRALLADALARRPGYVCVANVHTTMMGYFDSEYQRITNEATYAVPDGVPLVWAMKSLGVVKQDRVRGPSLMRDLVDLGRPYGLKHYLYGGSPAAVSALKSTLEIDYPGCQIVGAESPPFRPLEAISSSDWELDAQRINASGANIVWVGLGAPKQERWMWEQRARIQGVMLGVGAAFDLISGRIPEAPSGFQRLGLEWLYRLYREPKRLWRRYVLNNPGFLLLWGWQLARRKLSGLKS